MFLKQVVLILTLERTHEWNMACQFCIREWVGLLSLSTHACTIVQTQEVIDVCIQLQHVLNKLMPLHLVEIFEAI